MAKFDQISSKSLEIGKLFTVWNLTYLSEVHDELQVDRTDAPSKNIRRSIHYNQTASDEDSEFDDA